MKKYDGEIQKGVGMYGWRARLGILVPSKIMAIEPEFNRMAPEGVSCHYHRFAFRGGSRPDEVVERLSNAKQFVGDAAEMITHVQPTVVAMTGTGVSFIGGHDYDQDLIRMMKERNGNLPTTTTSTSAIEALRTLGITKVSMAMPYLEKVARTAVKFVEDSGFQVLNAHWLNKNSLEIPRLSNEEQYQLARVVDLPESEALFMPCVDLHTLDLIDKLENDLQKPVITSNQATLWNMLRLAGINDRLQGFGRLLSEH